MSMYNYYVRLALGIRNAFDFATQFSYFIISNFPETIIQHALLFVLTVH
jgi:hypothetical protein